ncbi:hypothetical protein CEXT_415081 [Caerostris extrusa]|uniref:Uncharacterized protein n=1 Tax=Caerostris extrusa TaxID=172846 RepID=A0AAV4NRR5_CAEEX|nr:hypothetical protein CEXT_415081 [Caerostris extrusa]
MTYIVDNFFFTRHYYKKSERNTASPNLTYFPFTEGVPQGMERKEKNNNKKNNEESRRFKSKRGGVGHGVKEVFAENRGAPAPSGFWGLLSKEFLG